MAENVIQIDLSGRLGLAPRFYGDIDRNVQDPQNRIIGTNGMMAQGYFNPFRRLGYSSATNTAMLQKYGPGSSDYEDVTPWSCSIYDADNGRVFFGLDGRFLHYFDHLDGGTGDGTADDWGNASNRTKDLEIYQINGVRTMFAVYDKAGTLEIAQSPTPWSAGSSDLVWLTNTVTNSFANDYLAPAFLRVADNGFMYLFNGNQVHKIDGTIDTGGADGTITPNVLLFPESTRICDALDNRGYMYIAVRNNSLTATINTSFTADCGVFVWDRLTTVASPQDFVKIGGCKEIRKLYVAPSGAIRALVVNSDDIVQIREYNGTTFVTIAETGQGSYPTYLDSFSVANNFVIWCGFDGNIYCHGYVSPGDPEGIFMLSRIISDDQVSNTGAILYGGDSEYTGTAGFKNYRIGLWLSHTDNNSGNVFIKLWDMYGTGVTGVTGVQDDTPIYTLVSYLPQMATIKHIDIYMAPSENSGNSTVADIGIFFNQSASPWAVKSILYDQAHRGYKRIEVNKQYVNAIQLCIVHTAAAMGNSEFFPSMAVVTYEPTSTRGSQTDG